MPSRLAFVTGTSSGIGSALLGGLLSGGWHVIGASRRTPARAHEAYEHLEIDLADPAMAPAVEQRLVERLRERPWSRIGLVNNAAHAGAPGPLERASLADTARAHAVNVAAPMWLMGLFVRLTPRDTPLRIVNVSSGAARQVVPGLAAYCSSKAALRMAGMVLAAELQSRQRNTPAPRDTAILSYEPGVVETPMQQAARGASRDEFPWVDLFLGFKEQGIVVEPERPAAEILAFLEGSAPVFSERRLGG